MSRKTNMNTATAAKAAALSKLDALLPRAIERLADLLEHEDARIVTGAVKLSLEWSVGKRERENPWVMPDGVADAPVHEQRVWAEQRRGELDAIVTHLRKKEAA